MSSLIYAWGLGWLLDGAGLNFDTAWLSDGGDYLLA